MIDRGAAIYVCGSLQGRAAGVHGAVVAAPGEAQVEALADNGHYRRDVY
jgi:sulfite reductase (NADPH) flavoprotein alpha-component